MKRNRKDSLCCGDGGGRMWIEIEEGERLAEIRTWGPPAVGVEIIATACPWCYTQLEHAIKTTGNEEKIQVRDLAELLHEATSQ